MVGRHGEEGSRAAGCSGSAAGPAARAFPCAVSASRLLPPRLPGAAQPVRAQQGSEHSALEFPAVG